MGMEWTFPQSETKYQKLETSNHISGPSWVRTRNQRIMSPLL